MPEISGNAALLIDPYNVEEISRAILDLSNNQTLRKVLRNKGYKRAEYFSWNKTAKLIIDQIESSI